MAPTSVPASASWSLSPLSSQISCHRKSPVIANLLRPGYRRPPRALTGRAG